jgi:hypothetical protein
VEQKQPYDKYDIAHNTETIPVEQKQPYDKYDIAQNTGTIPVEQKQPYDKYDIHVPSNSYCGNAGGYYRTD